MTGRPMPSADALIDFVKVEKERARKSDPEPIFECSDMGNAARLASIIGWCVRFVESLGWLIWDGKRWTLDDSNEIVSLAMQTVRTILDEVKCETDKKKEKPLLDHYLKSQSARSVRDMIALCRAEIGIAARASEFDRDPWMFNVENGTIDLQTCDLKPHRRQDLISKLSPVVYDAGAACPRWLSFLNEVMSGNHDLINFIQRAVGYSLSGDIREQCWFILWGTGSNGKTTSVKPWVT